MRCMSAAEKTAIDAPAALRTYTCAGRTRDSHPSTESRKLATIVAIAIISEKLATMPAMPIAAKLGA